MDLNGITRFIRELAAVFGPWLAFLLLVVTLIAGLILVDNLLRHGTAAVRLFVPVLRDVLRAITNQPETDNAAMRTEKASHVFCVLVFALSWGIIAAHSLLPWDSQIKHQVFYGLLVGSCVWFIGMVSISQWLDRRL